MTNHRLTKEGVYLVKEAIQGIIVLQDKISRMMVYNPDAPTQKKVDEEMKQRDELIDSIMKLMESDVKWHEENVNIICPHCGGIMDKCKVEGCTNLHCSHCCHTMTEEDVANANRKIQT